MPRTKPGQKAGEHEPVQAAVRPAYRELADVDSELITLYWRRLHATWEEDVEGLEEAKAAIDVLLERRFELMQAEDAEAASTCEVQAPVG